MATPDIYSAQAESRARDVTKAPPHPKTRLQERLDVALQEYAELLAKQRSGGPVDLSEIDRELTVCDGAIEGVHQRLAELTARLQPVLPSHVIAVLTGEDPGVRQDPLDEYEVSTEIGTRLRGLQREISSVASALSHLLAVRL